MHVLMARCIAYMHALLLRRNVAAMPVHDWDMLPCPQ